MTSVDEGRAFIDRLVMRVMMDSSQRKKKVETIDPVLRCAEELFPYLPERVLNQYARTALRIIMRPRNRTRSKSIQTTLTTHLANL